MADEVAHLMAIDVDGALQLRPDHLLGLTSKGFVLPARREGRPLHLRCADVLLIAALSDPAGTSASEIDQRIPSLDPARRGELLQQLADAGALTPAGAAPPPVAPVVTEPRARGPLDPSAPVQIPTPLTLRPEGGAVRWFDGAGSGSTLLDAATTAAMAAFVSPRTLDEGVAWSLEELGDAAPGADELAGALRRLTALGLVVPATDDSAIARARATADRMRQEELARNRAVFRAVARADQARREAGPLTGRVAVVPVAYPLHLPPLSLGMLLAYARAHDGGALLERYDLEPRWHLRKESLARVLEETGPAVFLLSHYVWSTEPLLEMSRLIKEASPQSITVHGGPSVPRHADDLATWMGEHPHVDVAVRSEGEITTAALLTALDGRLDGPPGERLQVLTDVAGLTYRAGDELVRTEDRGRIDDLDVLPSPYLTGVFAPWEQAGAGYVTIETNRGCPYGCTFCDWGQVTMSRIRQFDLERVFEELEWVGRANVSRLQVADANFGIYARDVQIAERIADVRRRTGSPKEVLLSFAKNTMKHCAQVVKILDDAGVITAGSISLQTTDPGTLDAIDRHNIRTEKYWELAEIFREQRLPLLIELMMGLPGSTAATFDADLQHCVDIDVQPRIHRTEVLVNSPMNEPEYRERFALRTEDVHTPSEDILSSPRRRRLVMASATFTRDEMASMVRFSESFAIFESYGLARHVARWVRQERGLSEVELYHLLDDAVTSRPERTPVLAWALETLHGHSAVPLDWRLFYADVARLLVEEAGCSRGDDLDTVLAVQQALVPVRGRTFPHTVELPHDFVAWHGEVLTAKAGGDHLDDWPAVVPPLRTFGPGTLRVEDPDGLCGAAIGIPIDMLIGDNWELESPVSRSAIRFRNL